MTRDFSILYVIQARAGSKGIPDKNIKLLNGRRLFEYAIEAWVGLTAELKGDLLFSSDSLDYCKLAEAAGVSRSLQRPASLAGGEVMSYVSLEWAVSQYETMTKKKIDYVVELPTVAPFRRTEDIEGCLRLLLADRDTDSVVSVVSIGEKHPVRIKFMDEHKILRDVCSHFEEVNGNSRRQDLLPEAFIRNGAVYAMRRTVLMKFRSRQGPRTKGYVMPVDRSLNIDEPSDWSMAEMLMKCKS